MCKNACTKYFRDTYLIKCIYLENCDTYLNKHIYYIEIPTPSTWTKKNEY